MKKGCMLPSNNIGQERRGGIHSLNVGQKDVINKPQIKKERMWPPFCNDTEK
jgi:hypothetical protein